MNTEYGIITLLDKNPRKIKPEALERLAESIERDPAFMKIRPIVIDSENIVIGGNQRLKACVQLGMSELPKGWVVKAADLTEEQRRRFIVVDNAPEGMAGTFDMDMLSESFADLDLSCLGFDLNVIAEELKQVEEKTEDLRAMKNIHILISLSVDQGIEILPKIEDIVKKAGGSIHHAGN